MNLSIDNRLLRHGLTVLGVASAALAGRRRLEALRQQ